MKNMKVSMKLLIGFSVLTLLGMIIGVVGLVGAHNLNTAATDMYQELSGVSDQLGDRLMTAVKNIHDRTDDIYFTLMIVLTSVMVASVLAAAWLTYYISGMISKPLKPLTEFMKRAGEKGDLEIHPEDAALFKEYAVVQDEIGQLIHAADAFVQHVSEAAKDLEIIANGDLTVHLDLRSDRDTIGVSLEKMVDNLSDMLAEMNTAAEQVSTGSTQIADGAQALAQGSTEQAATVEQLSASVAEIAEKTKENASMAGRAAELADTIKQNAEKGSRQMDEMMNAVKEIDEASQSINKVIKVIDDIAFQTNILSLNAAVEAARAGQHGKGFAVVADAVRNLAAKSSEAAKDTGALISNSMEKAKLGARIADETAASLQEIVSGIGESTQIVGEIAQSSQTQSIGISQVNEGIDQVAQVVQQNSATAEQSAAASEELSGQATLLEQLIAQFKLKGSSNHGRKSAPAAQQRHQPVVPQPQSTAFAVSDGSKY